MRNKLLCLFALVLVFVLALSLASCGDDESVEHTEIQGILAENGIYKITVNNSVSSFNVPSGILSKIKFADDAEYKFYTDKECNNLFSGETLALKEGDNFLYLKVSNEEIYTFDVYRNRLLTITFNPNGGTMENTVIQVEEGKTITKPAAARYGYTLSWAYDFSKPITSNLTIDAIWTPENCVIVTDVDGVETSYNVFYGEVPSVVKEPLKAGYNFAGWKYGNSWFDATAPYSYSEKEIKIVAVFELASNNVQYVLGYENVTNNNPTSYGPLDGTVVLNAPVLDDRHIFLGWYSDSTFAVKVESLTPDMLGKNITLYAKWRVISKVTLMDGETVKGTLELAVNESYKLDALEKDNYIFEGWYIGETLVANTGVWIKTEDVTLTAKWRERQFEIEYVIGYDNIQNDNPNKITVSDGTVALKPLTFDNKHLFDGWYVDSAFTTKIDSITSDMLGKDITLYAKWKVISVVTLMDGEIVKGTVEFVVNESYKLDVLEMDNYIFEGWFNNGTLVANTGIWVVSDDVTLTAKWRERQFDVEYVIGYDGIQNDNPNKYTITDGTVELKPLDFDEKHIFVGWYTDSAFTTEVNALTSEMLGKSITLYAKWMIVSKLTLVDGDDVIDTLDFTVGEKYELNSLDKAYYTFLGWYDDNGNLINISGVWTNTEDVTLTARWQEQVTNIDYVIGYENIENQNQSVYSLEYGTVDLLPLAYDERHEFLGWYTDSAFTNEVKQLIPDMIGTDVTLYAKWRVTTTVTLKNGDDVQTIDLVYGESYNLPKLTKDKYLFMGWTYNSNTVETSADSWMFDVDVELVAKWDAAEYQINYKVNGGEVSGNSTKYTIETDLSTIVVNDPTKQYATFDGWYFDADFTLPFNVEEIKNYEGVTLYAKWNAIVVTITFDADGGNVNSTEVKVNLGQEYMLPGTEKPGHVFEGWFLGETKLDKSICWTDESNLAITIKARWTVEVYKITYDLNGGTWPAGVTKVTEYSVSSEKIKLPTLTKEGCYFVGWSLNDGPASASVEISGSTGDLNFKAIWTEQKGANGLLYSMIDGKMVVVGIDREIDATIVNGIKIPSEFNGAPVVAIDSNAFKAFGEKFAKTQWANMQNSFVTIQVPTTVKRIGANAFQNCSGIKVTLYDPNQSYADYKAWDETVTWEVGNRSARDCIWNIRPAIGWTRYSKVPIPEGYDQKVPK